MKRKVFLLIMALIMLVLIILSIQVLKEDPLFIFLTISLCIIDFCFIYLFILETFIGRNSYECSNDVLKIYRRKELIMSIQRNEVENLVVVVDYVTEVAFEIKFKYNNKKYRIITNKRNREAIISFIDGLDYIKKTNYLYRLIEFFGFFMS